MPREYFSLSVLPSSHSVQVMVVPRATFSGLQVQMRYHWNGRDDVRMEDMPAVIKHGNGISRVRRPHSVPVRGLLIGVGYLQQRSFTSGTSPELETNG